MSYSYIDMHCDTLLHAVANKDQDIFRLSDTMLDVSKLVKAGAEAQFFAVFFPPKRPMMRPPEKKPEQKPGNGKHFRPPVIENDIDFFKEAREILLNTIDLHSNQVGFAKSIGDVIENKKNSKFSAFLSIEDARAVEADFDRIRWFYDQGVRMMSLTWNHENCFGFPNSRDPEIMQKGLTTFGKEAIEVMNDLGIVIDVSHLSDGGFYDVAKLTKAPFVASHSNTRALTNHPRNLTDDMIRLLAEKGGACGLNFGADFVEEQEHTGYSSVERICLHAKHLLDVGGEDIVAIGTDFDGVGDQLEIDEPGKMGLLFEGLKKHGFSERQIEKAARGNVERVVLEAMKAGE